MRSFPPCANVWYVEKDGGTFLGETVVTAGQHGDGRLLGWLRLMRARADRTPADARVEADLTRVAKQHRDESSVSAVAHSVPPSPTVQVVLENAVEAMRQQIERSDARAIFRREGAEAVLQAHSSLPAWVIV